MQVKYFLKDKSKDTTSVRAIIRHKGQRYQIAVGETVISKHWNDNKYRCRTSREYPEALHINTRLDDWSNLIENAINSFGLIIPTQLMLKNKIDEILRNRNIEVGGVIKHEDEQHLVAFALKYMQETDKSYNTKKSYQTTINKLIEYENKHKKKLRFIDIDINFYNHFKKWLMNSPYKKGENELYYTKNYIGAIFKNISKFMTASKGKLHEFVGYKDEEFKIESEETDAIFLNQDELQKIFDLKITEELLKKNGYKNQNLKTTIESLNEERDRFLIGCYTALRHSDYSRLDNIHFNDKIIRIWTVKRDKKVFIPMHYKVKEILERRNNIMPKPISAQKHNKQIKALGMLAGVTEEVSISKTRGGKRTEAIEPKYKFITTHTARRTGASNMYLAGIDIRFIQDVLGHEKIEQTMAYIKVSAEDNAKRLVDHPYFSGK